MRRTRDVSLMLRHGLILGLIAAAVLAPRLAGSAGPSAAHIRHSVWLEPLLTDADAIQERAQRWICLDESSVCGRGQHEERRQFKPNDGLEDKTADEMQAWATMEIRPGDTLFELAGWFGLAVEELAAANDISDVALIRAGQTLVIPIPASQFAPPPPPPAPMRNDAPLVYDAPVVAEPEPGTVDATQPPPVDAPGAYAPPPEDEVIAAICAQPWPCEKMVRIATCESRLDPVAHNRAGLYGLFQLDFTFEEWNDPWVNAQVAYEQKYLPALEQGDPLSPWPVCRWY